MLHLQSRYRVFTALGGDQSEAAARRCYGSALLQNFVTEVVNAFSRGGSRRVLARQRLAAQSSAGTHDHRSDRIISRFLFAGVHGQQIYSNAHAAAR